MMRRRWGGRVFSWLQSSQEAGRSAPSTPILRGRAPPVYRPPRLGAELMREAVIVAAKRTPIGKAYRGAFNNTHGATLGAEAIRAAVAQAGVDPGEIDDIAMGAAIQQGTTGSNIARQAALPAGLPN